jgi:hypothetical protein
LKWDIHVKNVSSKLGKSYNAMQSLTGTISLNILGTAYFATRHSHLQASHTLWDEVMGENKTIFKIQ